jgi:integration host factor subunit beta
MTKSDLIKSIATDSSLSVLKAEEVVNVIVEKLFGTLEDGGRIELRGFGSFRVNEYDAYVGRNPKTGNIIQVSQKKLPFFKPGKELREKVNI